MTIRARGSSFQVDVKVAGKDNPTREVVRVRATAKDENTARRLEAEIRAAVMQCGHWAPNTPSAPSRVQGTLEAALQEAWSYPSGRLRGWKYQRAGQKQYDRAKACVDILGPSRHCATITTADHDNLTLHFERLGNGSDTLIGKIQAFRRILWHAQRKGWITHRPLWDRPAAGQPREFMYTPDMERRVIEFFRTVARDNLMADLFTVAIETGLRLGELLRSPRRAWDIEARTVTISAEIAKSGRARTVTLTGRAAETISPWLEACAQLDDRPFRVSAYTVSQRMKKARTYLKEEANKHFIFHATRHTRATRLAAITRDPFIVMSQLGHGDIQTSMRYIKMAGVDVTVIEGQRIAGSQVPNVTL